MIIDKIYYCAKQRDGGLGVHTIWFDDFELGPIKISCGQSRPSVNKGMAFSLDLGLSQTIERVNLYMMIGDRVKIIGVERDQLKSLGWTQKKEPNHKNTRTSL